MPHHHHILIPSILILAVAGYMYHLSRSIPHLRSLSTPASRAMSMQIIPLKARSDNWMYLIISPNKEAAVVDPYDWKAMWALVKEKGVEVTGLLSTHHHDDHTGGNLQFLANAPKNASIKVYAGSSSPGANTLISDASVFPLSPDISVRCLHTPCHTQDSICYYLTDTAGNKAVFTGDTLFQGGCGRFFEGTPEEMLSSLTYLGTLPDDTTVYNGHEYTLSSARFGLSIEPSNSDIQRLLALAETEAKHGTAQGGGGAGGCTAGKSTVGDEKLWNVFMRTGEEAVRKATGEVGAVGVMRVLREMKNKF